MQHTIRLAYVLAPLAAAACGDSIVAPGAGAPLSHDISADQLADALDAAPARVEIKLEPGSLVAREVELKTADEMADEESIRGRVSAVAVSGDAGALTFSIGALEVGFTAAARFRDAEGETLTMAEFASQVQEALDAGVEPAVRAKRPPASEPQAPDDATFTATDLRLMDGLESAKIELNVDADNLTSNDQPPPQAWLTVLGLAIEIRTTTEIEADDDEGDETEVEGMVASVDQAAGSVTLADGTVILIVAETGFENGDEDEDEDDEHLTSLAAVAEALEAGLPVKAEAEGSVQATDPLTILAREVEFEVEDEDDGDDDDDDGQPQGVEFESAVASADVAAGTFVLSNGATVRLTESTVISEDGDLQTLQAVADALAAGRRVEAEGRAAVESAGPPATLAALTVKWEVDED